MTVSQKEVSHMGIRERKEREREARREEIIGAAEKVFFQKGLTQATMDEIAEAAELSKGTLYLYYKSKEDLYLTVSMTGTDILLGKFQEVAASSDHVVKQLMGLLDEYYKFFQSYRHYFRMFYFLENRDVHSQVSPEMLDACTRSDQRLWEVVTSVIRKAIDQRMLHAGLDPMEVAVIMWSNSHGFMRLIDRGGEAMERQMGVSFETALRRSNAMLMEAMMSKKAKRLFPSLLQFHETEQEEEGGEQPRRA